MESSSELESQAAFVCAVALSRATIETFPEASLRSIFRSEGRRATESSLSFARKMLDMGSYMSAETFCLTFNACYTAEAYERALKMMRSAFGESVKSGDEASAATYRYAVEYIRRSFDPSKVEPAEDPRRGLRIVK